MSRVGISTFWASAFLAVLIAGCQRSDPVTDQSNLLQLDDGAFQVTGPFVHENLAVFLLDSDQQDDRNFITLDEGLKNETVKVSEQKQAQVQQLEIENTSDSYLFLQEGDRVVGGQQDRIIITSLVIPPHSGKMPLPSFCVEAGRWVGNKAFHGGANAALAPKEVRQASKVSNQQGEVWRKVKGIKDAASTNMAVQAPNTNTSLTETLEAPRVKKLSEEFAQALEDVLAEHPKAVGVVIAVNGQVEEVNLYPSRQLLGKLYPRLLQSYALQAVMEKDKAGQSKELTVADIRNFMTEKQEQAKATSREVNKDNELRVCDEAKKTQCQTVYDGQVVHRQWLNKGEAAEAMPEAEAAGQLQIQRAQPNAATENAKQAPKK
jgi:hypothetical protein